jgi:hypothetical protein
MEFTLEERGGGWVLYLPQNGHERVSLEVQGARLDRGVIRATLTARIGNTIVCRDTVNLTSERTRARVIEQLAAKGISIDEGPLVALDEACRVGRPDGCDAPPDAAGTVEPIDLAGLREAFDRWLLIEDRDLLTVIVGAALAHRFGSDPVWLLVVAPPGGTKTEPIRALYDCPGFYPLSELTPKTFASGLEVPGGRDPSLLHRLTDQILILKDFTTVLEMRREDRQAILAQLREIYDGRFDKTWGTGRELRWEGRLGFIAGVTPIIDKHQAAMSLLGERFVLFRLKLPPRIQLAMRALSCSGREREMREELARAMRGFLAGRGSTAPVPHADVLGRIAAVADFVTRARSGVQRDGWKRELEYAPEPEAPTRFAKVLAALALGIAMAHDSPAVTGREQRLVLRVALDCLPLIRRRVIAALVEQTITEEGDRLSTSAIAGAAQFSTTAIRRALEDLQALGLLACHKAGRGRADEWALAAQWVIVFRDLVRESECGDDWSAGVS